MGASETIVTPMREIALEDARFSHLDDGEKSRLKKCLREDSAIAFHFSSGFIIIYERDNESLHISHIGGMYKQNSRLIDDFSTALMIAYGLKKLTICAERKGVIRWAKIHNFVFNKERNFYERSYA